MGRNHDCWWAVSPTVLGEEFRIDCVPSVLAEANEGKRGKKAAT